GRKKQKQTGSNPFEMFMNQQGEEEEIEEVDDSVRLKRRDIKSQLLAGKLEDEKVTIEVQESSNQLGMMMPRMDNNGMGEMRKNLMAKKNQRREMTEKKASQ